MVIRGSGTNWGGAGGNAHTDHSAATTGGCGNPTGSNAVTSTIGSGGSITCIGSNSGACSGGNGWHGSGGASGGGNIVIAHKGTYTNNGTVTANGGTSGTTTSNST